MDETNEVLALAFVVVAFAATLAVRAHHSNTPRTRNWWGRFLVLLAFLLAAEIATNIEEFFAETSSAHQVLNVVEHVSLVVAGGWALALSARGLAESHARRDGQEVEGS